MLGLGLVPIIAKCRDSLEESKLSFIDFSSTRIRTCSSSKPMESFLVLMAELKG